MKMLKNANFTLLSLVMGFVLTSCNNVHYIECSSIDANDISYRSYNANREMYRLVIEFRAAGEKVDGGTVEENQPIYIYVDFYKNSPITSIPTSLTYENGGPYGYTKIDYVKTIGTYISYRRYFISSDEKKIKTEEVSFEPVDAPYDKEVQGKPAFRYEFESYYLSLSVITIHRNEIIDVNPDYELSYTYLEKQK